MKRLLIGLSLSLSLFAEKSFEFNPALLIEAEAIQSFEKDEDDNIPKAEFGLGKVEAGFEIAYEKVSGIINYEFDAEDEGRILLNEAFTTVSPTDFLSISAGQFVNSFGLIESDALSDPLIFDDIETKAPGLQLDYEGEKFFGSFTMFQGSNNEDFRSFVPTVGISLDEKIKAKLSSRIEVLDNTSYFDFCAALAVAPIELLKFQAELYTEGKEKTFINEEDTTTQKVLGYYAEVGVFPKDELSIIGRFDQRINDLDADSKSGTTALEFSAGYQFFDPFCLHIGLTFVNDYAGDEDNWNSGIAVQAAFEL